ncbi:hypothetical protein L1887_35148 [Cichorium endivia]|nr:hypothetical protein L1887_35148 [Cichorium endivia]
MIPSMYKMMNKTLKVEPIEGTVVILQVITSYTSHVLEKSVVLYGHVSGKYIGTSNSGSGTFVTEELEIIHWHGYRYVYILTDIFILIYQLRLIVKMNMFQLPTFTIGH